MQHRALIKSLRFAAKKSGGNGCLAGILTADLCSGLSFARAPDFRVWHSGV
jgi:hypothetical protein